VVIMSWSRRSAAFVVLLAVLGALATLVVAAPAGAASSGPVYPAPSGLWAPAYSALPSSGNYVYLESQAGDYIGAGQVHTYTQANAILGVTSSGGLLTVNVTGDETWSGNFQAMNTIPRLQVGYYANLARYPFHDPAVGGLSWTGDGRGCNTSMSWMVVNAVSYDTSGNLTGIDLRFEQHCEGMAAALHGKVHWKPNDPTAPPPPVTPIPAGLWSPAAGSTPASGNYIYLDSQPGDYIGAGQVHTYTQADAILTLTRSTRLLQVGVNGDEGWSGDFAGMSSIADLQPGYYPNLKRYPFHNPTRGGLSWSGEGRGCNTLTGWFAIDSITITGGTLVAVDLRFEQHCEGGSAALRGKIHYTNTDTTTPPGPINPPPPNLWRPASGAVPLTGNYVYLKSTPGDWVGQGQTLTYTPANATLNVSATGAHLAVSVNGATWWNGDFVGMSSITRLKVGYYPNLQRYPFHNPTKGGLSWSGDGRGCNTLTGWFVVNAVTYDAGGALKAIDLRFEQHCDGGPALNGKVHWTAA
jgi:hypothetical protein